MRLAFAALLGMFLTGCIGMPSPEEIQRRQAETDQRNSHLQHAISLGLPVYVNSKVLQGPNSVGGASVMYSLRNISSKPVKYINLHLVPYNSVGDAVPSEVGGKKDAWVKFTGPLASMEFTYPTWSNVWYNHSLKCVQLEEMEVVFMDGEIRKLESANIKNIFSQSFSNTCKV